MTLLDEESAAVILTGVTPYIQENVSDRLLVILSPDWLEDLSTYWINELSENTGNEMLTLAVKVDMTGAGGTQLSITGNVSSIT